MSDKMAKKRIEKAILILNMWAEWGRRRVEESGKARVEILGDNTTTEKKREKP